MLLCILTVIVSFSVHLSCSVMSDSLRPHGLQHARPPLSTTNSRSLLKLMSIESVMPSNHLILCHPLLLLPSIFPSIKVFSNELSLHIRWPKYWSFQNTVKTPKSQWRPSSWKYPPLPKIAGIILPFIRIVPSQQKLQKHFQVSALTLCNGMAHSLSVQCVSL